MADNVSGTNVTTTVQTLAVTNDMLHQIGTTLQAATPVEQNTVSNYVNSLVYLSWLPAKTISFQASGMKPNTRVWAYFDNVPVTNWCSTPIPENYSQDNIDASQQTTPYGTAEKPTILITDNNGKISGLFSIPPKQFKSQQIVFRLIDIENLVQGESAITTEADGTYYGSTLSQAIGSTTFNTRTTKISSAEVSQDLSISGLTAVTGDPTKKFIPDPVYTPQGGGGSGCGCGCFIGSSLITLASGEQIPINEIKIGDKIYNYNKTVINTVKFIEKINGKYFDNMYSPTEEIKPFATNNHPLYINDELSCMDPDRNQNWYPWLGKNKKINAFIGPVTNDNVYNLWIDGDGTYIVNGFGTTSIIGDGGLLRLCFEQGLITYEQTIEIVYHYITSGKYTVYGIYLFNELFGKLNIKIVNKLIASVLKSDNIGRNICDKFFKTVGRTVCLVK
jgi:hypothetical protein